MSDWTWYLLLIPAGFIAGVVNTIAGGGSFLTLPALMFVAGLDSKVANATNRIAILFSSATASYTFHKHGQLDLQLARKLALPTLLGVPLGAWLAKALPPETFKPVFGAIFLIMAIVLMLDPKRLTERRSERKERPWLAFFVFFGIGVYVGFIQAGMGMLLLLGMTLLNSGDLVASNGVKNLLGFVVTLTATLLFAWWGMIDWIPGLITASGNIVGGIVGAKLAIRRGNKLIFWFLLTVMLATGIKLIWPS